MEKERAIMNYQTDVQLPSRPDVRPSWRQSRVRRSLAGGVLAAALLVGGVGSAHIGQHATVSQQTGRSSVRVSPAMGQEQPASALFSYHVASDYVSMARQAAQRAGINADAFVRQIQQESGFRTGAVSGAGAVGIAQFMPATAASLGVNPYDPSSALNGAAQMMAGLSRQFGGDYAKALAAYNAGGGAVQAAVARGGGNWLAYMPGETQHYVHIIWG